MSVDERTRLAAVHETAADAPAAVVAPTVEATPNLRRRAALLAFATGAVSALAGCEEVEPAASNTASSARDGALSRPDEAATGPATDTTSAKVSASAKPATDAEAVRFLNQATFGATQSDIDRVKAIGYGAWLDEQFDMPVQHNHVDYVKALSAQAEDPHWRGRPTVWDMGDSLWIGLMEADQLRQRVMFALSQIFVVSMRDGALYYQGNGLAAYVDMLYANCFGNWRTLIEGVTRSTAMGWYLSHIYNRKENPTTGSQPDQNFARELMQLFSIGLWQLNADGTRKLDADGNPIATYSSADVAGVSKVMTGWAYEGATDSDWNHYNMFDSVASRYVQERPMQAYAAYHSTSQKRFLGVTIAATGTPDPVGNLKILLDTLFNHSNAGPFFCKQLIQRLVTSNPSPEYVSRISAVFNNNGSGKRGDLRAVVKAILLDDEARDASFVTKPTYGKVREQLVRMLNIMRVFKATTGVSPLEYGLPIWNDGERSKKIWQFPLCAASVFNFYSPTYTPANSELKKRDLVAPEMQIVTQASVGDTAWYFADLIQNGGLASCCDNEQRNTFFMKFDYSDWLPLVSNPGSVADRLNKFFMAGQMSTELRSTLIAAMNAQTNGGSETSGMQRGVSQMKLARAAVAMLCSPEYVVQK